MCKLELVVFCNSQNFFRVTIISFFENTGSIIVFVSNKMSSPSAFSQVKYDVRRKLKCTQTPEDIVQLILSPLQGTEDSFFVGLVCKFWNSVMQRDTSIPEHKLWRYYASFGNISALELLQQILQSA